MTIREFIELQMKIYRLEQNDENFNKIKVKITRELKKIDSWFKITKKQTVGKTSAFVLDETTKKQLEIAMKPYLLKIAKINHKEFQKVKQINEDKAESLNSPFHNLLKIAKINHKEFQKVKQINEDKAESLNSPFHKSSIPQEEAYIYKVPNHEKMFVMIEALFNEKFDLDEEAWNGDYTNYNLFLNDEEALTSDSLALSNLRLQNPLKYYVKKK